MRIRRSDFPSFRVRAEAELFSEVGHELISVVCTSTIISTVKRHLNVP